MTKNKSLYIVLSILMAVFLLASSIVFPLDKGLLGNLGVSLGRDLQGGTYLVYKADLSSVEEGTEDEIMKRCIQCNFQPHQSSGGYRIIG